MKKNWKKIWGYKNKSQKIPDFMKKIEKKCEGTKTNLDKICRYENFGYMNERGTDRLPALDRYLPRCTGSSRAKVKIYELLRK